MVQDSFSSWPFLFFKILFTLTSKVRRSRFYPLVVVLNSNGFRGSNGAKTKRHENKRPVLITLQEPKFPKYL